MGHAIGLNLVFQRAKQAIMLAFMDQNPGMSQQDAENVAANAVLTQDYLRLEAVVSATVTQYTLPVLSNAGTPFLTEERLNLQDAFYVSEIVMYVGLSLAANGGATATAFPLYTYNSPTVFSTTGAALALENLYAGKLTISVNQSVILPSWDLLKHKVINQTQATGATLTAPFDQANFAHDGGYPSEPNIVLIGSKANVITITIPGAIATLQASATTKIVLMFRGIRAQNVTPVN